MLLNAVVIGSTTTSAGRATGRERWRNPRNRGYASRSGRGVSSSLIVGNGSARDMERDYGRRLSAMQVMNVLQNSSIA